MKKVFRLFGFVNVRIWSTAATFTSEDLPASLAIITPVTLAAIDPQTCEHKYNYIDANCSLSARWQDFAPLPKSNVSRHDKRLTDASFHCCQNLFNNSFCISGTIRHLVGET